jgi:outer membrane protein TolC
VYPALLGLALACAGCGAPRVERSAEIERFQREGQARLAALSLDPARPMTLADCEAIALKNNLEYRTRLLQSQLQDDQVRLALTGFLPRGELAYLRKTRSNEPLVSVFGGAGIAFEDQSQSAFSFHALIPIFDFGNTYFAWQIAKDRRAQDRLATVRARQQLLRDVRIRYARHAAELRQEALWATAVKAAQELLKVAESFEREGLGAAADTAQVKATVAEAGKHLLLARHRVREAKLLLAHTLSLPSHAEFRIDSTLPALPEPLTPERLLQLEEHALRARPELWVQDLERHVAAHAVRKEISGFFPRVDGMVNFDWTSLSQQVNPSFWTFGASVAHSLLDSGSKVYKLQMAKKGEKVEAERALLLGLGILYEVDLSALQVAKAHSNVLASREVVSAHEVVVKQIWSRYREGLEAGADLAKAVAQVHAAMLDVDRAQTDYLTAWYDLQAAAVPDEARPDDSPAKEGPAAGTPAAPSDEIFGEEPWDEPDAEGDPPSRAPDAAKNPDRENPQPQEGGTQP